jgi:tetratricopeptide (TPR) repeat protein
MRPEMNSFPAFFNFTPENSTYSKIFTIHMKYFLILFSLLFILFSCKDGEEKTTKSEVNKEVKTDQLEELSDEIVESPNDPNLYIKRALIYRKRNLLDLGLKDVDRALSIDSTVSYFHSVKGDFFFAKGELRNARLSFENAIRFDDTNTEALVKLGEVNFYLRRYEEALDHINNALREDDQLAQAYFLKGYIFKELGDTVLAKSSFQTATEVNPSHFEAFMELGSLYSYENDPLAIDYFETALQINPKSAEAYYNKGMFLQSNGKIDQALQVYQAMVKADPNNFLGYYNMGYIYLTEYLEYETAQAYFDSVLMVKPAYVDALYNKGLCSEEMGRKGEAESIYRQVLDINPQHDLAARGLERVLYE